MKQGEMLMLSTEEYSDETHSGPYKVLRDFDIVAVAKLVAETPPEDQSRWRKKNGPDDVIDYLERNGFIEMLPCRRVHLGCYGSIELTGDLT